MEKCYANSNHTKNKFSEREKIDDAVKHVMYACDVLLSIHFKPYYWSTVCAHESTHLLRNQKSRRNKCSKKEKKAF